MRTEKQSRSVLIVSSSDKGVEYINKLLPASQFSPVVGATSAAEARRKLLEIPIDIVVINTPLPDELGIQFAIDLAEDGTRGVMILVKSDVYEQVAYRVEDYGIFTVQKPNASQVIYQAIKLLSVALARYKAMEKKNTTLQKKMEDIRIVNRAKWILIEKLKMTETEAHYYIEKQAMDTRRARRDIAESIIKTYE